MIDWTSTQSEHFLNPRLPPERLEYFQTLLEKAPALKSHLWLATSGTSALPKLVALSKRAFLVAAQSVNAFLRVQPGDAWVKALPSFHVGGLSIYARAHLSQSPVFDLPVWSAQNFVEVCTQHSVAFASLVSAQVYDLVQAQLRAPTSLKIILVGGDALPEALYEQARQLGWPLLPSYGMSETCAVFAAYPLSSLLAKNLEQSPSTAPVHQMRQHQTLKHQTLKYQMLNHLKARQDAQGRLQLQGESLLSGYMRLDENGNPQFYDPKENNIFTTEDVVELSSDSTELRVLGRSQDFIKIGAEAVNFKNLENIFNDLVLAFKVSDAVLLNFEDERLGRMVVAAFAGREKYTELVDAYNQRVAPFERIRKSFELEKIPRSILGKLERESLRDMIRRDNLNALSF